MSNVWERHFTPDGIDYYFNTETEQTVWNQPEDYVSSSEEEYDIYDGEDSEEEIVSGDDDQESVVKEHNIYDKEDSEEGLVSEDKEPESVVKEELDVEDVEDVEDDTVEQEHESRASPSGDAATTTKAKEGDEEKEQKRPDDELDPEVELLEAQMKEAELRAQSRQRAVESAELDARSELEAEARSRAESEEAVEKKERNNVDGWKNEADFADGFLGELQMWGLFDKPQLSEEGISIDQEKAQLVKKYLEDGTGSDDEWIQCFRANNYAITEYMLLLVDVVEDAVLVLAHAGNLYPYLWSDYVTSDRRLWALVANTVTAAQKVVSNFKDEKQARISRKNYIGYDERDTDTYGANNVEAEEDLDSSALKEKEDSEQQTIAANLLMMFHAYTEDIPFLKAALRSPTPQTIFLADLNVKHENLLALASSDGKTSTIPKLLKALCVFLLVRNIHYTEEAYLVSIRVMSCINHQFVHDLEQQSTEMASIIAHTEINDAEAVGISEGLMHLLNGVGYPSHTEPETLPVVRLCADLIMASTDGYFYSNDLTVMADVVVRELQNIPPVGEDEDESARNEELRVYYIQLAGALLNRQLLEGHKEVSVRNALALLCEESKGREECAWSSDMAAAVLEAY